MHELIPVRKRGEGFPLEAPAPAASIAELLGVDSLDEVHPADIIDQIGDKLAGDRSMRYGYTPDDVRHDNTVRAFIALHAVMHSERALDSDPERSEPIEQIMGDLLANLMHLCDAARIPFLDLVRSAAGHYNTELVGH